MVSALRRTEIFNRDEADESETDGRDPPDTVVGPRVSRFSASSVEHRLNQGVRLSKNIWGRLLYGLPYVARIRV